MLSLHQARTNLLIIIGGKNRISIGNSVTEKNAS